MGVVRKCSQGVRDTYKTNHEAKEARRVNYGFSNHIKTLTHFPIIPWLQLKLRRRKAVVYGWITSRYNFFEP